MKVTCRTLYVQLACPLSIVDLVRQSKNTAPQEEHQTPNQDLQIAITEDRSKFQKAALHLFLTCHVVVWAQNKQMMESDTVQHLRILQVICLKMTLLSHFNDLSGIELPTKQSIAYTAGSLADLQRHRGSHAKLQKGPLEPAERSSVWTVSAAAGILQQCGPSERPHNQVC